MHFNLKKRTILLFLSIFLVLMLAAVVIAQTSGTVEIKAPNGTVMASNTCSGGDFECSVTYHVCESIGQYTAHFTADGEEVSDNAYFCDCLPGTDQCSLGDYQQCNATGKWVTITPAVEAGFCSDSFDNNCNGLIDLDDSACFGSSGGFVSDVNGVGIFESQIQIFLGTQLVASDLTDGNGKYDTPSRGGNLTIVASHPNFVSKTFPVEIFPVQYTWINFSNEGGSPETNAGPLLSATDCESDCTYAGDNTVHASCNGKKGCSFYDSLAAQVCDLTRPGWLRDYNSTHEVECAEGTPKDVLTLKTSIDCEKENLIKITKVVNYKGTLVNLVVVACG